VGWAVHVSRDEMERRASGRRRHNKLRQQAAAARREEVRQLLQRWGTTAAAKVKMARRFRVSISTITRDVRALQERPPIPALCPLCGLPSRLDIDPAALLDGLDAREAAALERAMARLIGVEAPEALPRQRQTSRPRSPKRRQRDERPELRVQTLGETAPHAWG
jgi:hypothetical protein